MKLQVFFPLFVPFIYGQSIVTDYNTSNVIETESNDPVVEESAKLPNILVFIVDDLGWNQVGYHANKVGNNEIQTPNIDKAAKEGIELNRGYVTPWYVPENIYNITITTDSSNGH
jgi:Sulfatase